MQNGAATLKSSLTVSPNVKHRVNIWSNSCTPKSVYPREMKTYIHIKTPNMNIHSVIVHNSQKMEIIQMSIDWWMEK